MPLQDAFHVEMRRRMKENYFEKGGKTRLAYKRFLKNHNLKAEEFFKGKEELSIEEKVELLKVYAKANYKPRKIKSEPIVTEENIE